MTRSHLPTLAELDRWPEFTADRPLAVLVSACIAGIACGSDATSYGAPFPHTAQLLALPNVRPVTFCPEDFAFGTPRDVPDIHDGNGYDVLDGRARVIGASGESCLWRASGVRNGHALRMGELRRQRSVEIVRFRREDQTAVRRLILEGLEEHWGVLDPQFNADLDDIDANYAVGTVLVARDSGRIVGVGAITPIAPGEGEVKRMSVARDARRRGLGTALLMALLEDARERGWRSVRLETTADWEDAVQFYCAFGFELTHYEDGAFGRDAYFRMVL